MNLLTIGAEYSNQNTLYGNGIKSADLFEEALMSKFKIDKKISLRGNECTAFNIKNAFHSLINSQKLIIYYAGHGDHFWSHEKNIEYWNTTSGNIDQVQIALSLNEFNINSFIVLFSESFSSEHMVNKFFIERKYVSFGATRDAEDAIMTSDGGLFSLAVIDTINNIDKDCNVENFTEHIPYIDSR